MNITPEEKERWKRSLQRTWDAIAYDVIVACGGEAKRRDVIEMVCDANRPEMFGDMTREEYKVLCAWYSKRSFKIWMKEVFPSDGYVI